jgi:hypothetical protein
MPFCVKCNRVLTSPGFQCPTHPHDGIRLTRFAQDISPEIITRCRVYVFLWIKYMMTFKKRGIGFTDINHLYTANFTMNLISFGVSTSNQNEIAQVMESQTKLLNAIVYPHVSSEGPYKDVHSSNKIFAGYARVNQKVAISTRHILASKWAQDNNFECVSTLHTFSSTYELVFETVRLARLHGGILGYLSLQGAGGHALGFGYQPVTSVDNDFTVVFFDPNSGEYLFRNSVSFASSEPSAAWLNYYLSTRYPKLMNLMYVHFFA